MKNSIFYLLILILVVISSQTYAQKIELWGMTSDGNGSIFKTDSIGNNISKVYSFEDQGRSPGNNMLCKASNGKLYGMTTAGGTYGKGVIYVYDTVLDTYLKLHDFLNDTIGYNPIGGLTQANNNRLYGTTTSGGAYGSGVFFEFDIASNSIIKIVDYNDSLTGTQPAGRPILISNGELVGLNQRGGVSGSGTIYKYNPNSKVFTKTYDLDSITTGAFPIRSFVQVYNKLYAVCKFDRCISTGSYQGSGKIFEYDIVTNSCSILTGFNQLGNLVFPNSNLCYINGKLYGTTVLGGTNYHGVIFEYNIAVNTLSVKYNFTSIGSFLNSTELTAGQNGNIYGIRGDGNVMYSFSTFTNAYSTVVTFDGQNKGSYPVGGLTPASNVEVYGICNTGGINNNGTVFKVNVSSNGYTKLYDFEGPLNGSNPKGDLLLASNGKFYGMTSAGGTHDKGVLFEYDPRKHSYVKKVDFNGSNGSNPEGRLIQAANGKLYGLTPSGGSGYSNGILFEYDILNDTLTVKYSFAYSVGSVPKGSLFEGSSNILYGMTSTYLGGAGGIFKYDIFNDTITLERGFSWGANGYLNGVKPFGSFIKSWNGRLYAMTTEGGQNGKGVLFEYNHISGVYTKKVDFEDSVKGATPYGDLVETPNGKLYGMTSLGGSYNEGVLFEYTANISNFTYTKKVDLNGFGMGGKPTGSLLPLPNGKLYGMTPEGGIYNQGVVFEYDPNNNLYVVKHHFSGIYGGKPMGSLIAYDACYETPWDTITVMACRQYVSPSGKIWTTSGVYFDTTSNVSSCDTIYLVNLIISNVDTSVTRFGDTLFANISSATYQWIKCDTTHTPILGATNQSFIPTYSGDFAVQIVSNGCIDTSSCYPVLGVGLENNHHNDFSIQLFPNPSSSEVNIRLSNSQKLISVIIRDVLGKVVYQNDYNDVKLVKMKLDISPGLYFVEVKSIGEKRKLLKLLIE